uniref:EF-hand domain-containing protein n=1 Tax=Kalanchoe fedtschenkoi TaxID=63787 RepID=A0A7N0T1X0_KALFE
MCRGAGGVAKAEKPAPALRPAFDIFSQADEEVIDSMISAADSDRNGFVEHEKFERVFRPRRSGNRGYGYEVVEEAFKVTDGDGDGKVGCDDLR